MTQPLKDEYEKLVEKIRVSKEQYYGFVGITFSPDDLTNSFTQFFANIGPELAIVVMQTTIEKLQKGIDDNVKSN